MAKCEVCGNDYRRSSHADLFALRAVQLAKVIVEF